MSYPPTSSAEVAHPKTPPLGVLWPRPPAGLFRFQPPGARSAMTRHAARRQRFISGLHPLWGRSAGCPGTGDQRRHRSSATPSESESGAIAPAARRRRRRCRPNEAADLRSSAGGSRPRPRPAGHPGGREGSADPRGGGSDSHRGLSALHRGGIAPVPFLETRPDQGGSVECNRCPGLKTTP